MLARLIANWAITAAAMAVIMVSEIESTAPAAQLGLNTINALKLLANTTSPTSVVSQSARFKVAEKNIANTIL